MSGSDDLRIVNGEIHRAGRPVTSFGLINQSNRHAPPKLHYL
jgi:hypothetical protein